MPRRILQRAARRGWPARLRASAGLGGGAVLVHVALGAGFFYLLSFRDTEVPREVEIPVEVVAEVPKPTAAPKAQSATSAGGQAGGLQASGSQASGLQASAAPAAPAAAPIPQPAEKPVAPTSPPALPAASPASAKPAPATPRASDPVQPQPVQPLQPRPAQPRPATSRSAEPLKLVAPPPEAARSATQDRKDGENRPANLVPDEHQVDQATHEARPAPVPSALTTADPRATASVPAPTKPQPTPVNRPTPAIPAKTPSQADKLAAVLPMDASALPSPFRSVLAGNAAAQINAAYGGVVQGRIRQATAELSAAASAQRLSGNVAVSFTIDDAGRLAQFAIVHSSGSAELDAMVRRAIEGIVPFPPPPPEAEHTFNKAFLVGG